MRLIFCFSYLEIDKCAEIAVSASEGYKILVPSDNLKKLFIVLFGEEYVVKLDMPKMYLSGNIIANMINMYKNQRKKKNVSKWNLNIEIMDGLWDLHL